MATNLATTAASNVATDVVKHAAPLSTAPVIERWTTPQGVPVSYVARRAIPIVDINIDFDAGSIHDPVGKAGVSEMVASLLLTGQKKYGDLPAMTEEEAEHAFDEIGAKLPADAQADRLSVGLRSLSHPVLLDRALVLLNAMLAVPAWPTRPFERERERLLAFAEEQQSDPEQLCNLTLTQKLYGKHPYGVVATEASINGIDRADVGTFHRTYLVRSRALITLVGDLSRDQAEALAERLGAALPVSKQTADSPAAPDAPNQLSELVGRDKKESLNDVVWVDHPASQAHIALGTLVPGVGDPDYFPLMVANRMFSWRLNDVVRDKLGLAYEVSSALFMSRLGEHRIALKTRADQAERALAAVSETLRGFTEGGIDVAEFERTQAELIQGRALAFDSNAKLLRHASDMAFDRLPADYLQTWTTRVAAVSLSQAIAVFGKWIRADRQVTVIVGGDKPGDGRDA